MRSGPNVTFSSRPQSVPSRRSSAAKSSRMLNVASRLFQQPAGGPNGPYCPDSDRSTRRLLDQGLSWSRLRSTHRRWHGLLQRRIHLYRDRAQVTSYCPLHVALLTPAGAPRVPSAESLRFVSTLYDNPMTTFGPPIATQAAPNTTGSMRANPCAWPARFNPWVDGPFRPKLFDLGVRRA